MAVGSSQDKSSRHSRRGVGTLLGFPAERPEVFAIFGELWSQALLAVGEAEEEVRKLLEKLAEVTEFRPDDLPRVGRELVERLARERKELEESLERSLAHALSLLRPPTPDDLAALHSKLDTLGERLMALEQRRRDGHVARNSHLPGTEPTDFKDDPLEVPGSRKSPRSAAK